MSWTASREPFDVSLYSLEELRAALAWIQAGADALLADRRGDAPAPVLRLVTDLMWRHGALAEQPG